jgi:hypothetical protein
MSNKLRSINSVLRSETALTKFHARSREHSALLQQVRRLLPSPLDQHCLAAVLRDQRLILFTDSSAWASRLRYFSRDLVFELQQERLKVTKASIHILAADRQKKRKRRHILRISQKNAQLLRQIADDTSDPALSDALRRLSRHQE